MQNSKHIKKIVLWLAGITGLVLAGTAAVTQIQKASEHNITVNKLVVKDTVVSYAQDEDSVEVIGTPTNDDPWQEVKKLVAAYYNNSGIVYKGTMKVIDGNQETEKVIEEQPFEYSILNNDYHYRLAHMEMVSRKNFLLAVDHNNKTISIAPNGAMSHTNKTFDIRAFKKIMEKGQAQARVTQLGEEKILTIDHIADPDIQGYRIHYSPVNYRIKKMLIGMARLEPLEEDKVGEGSDDETVDTWYYYLEVLFTQVDLLGLNEKDFHPENKFIEVHDGRWSLTPAFKEYQLLNGHEE
jgi:hypothetical protein